MTRRGRYPAEIRERAVRMVFKHEREHPSQWATITSIASKFGMTAETLRTWVRRAEAGAHPAGRSAARGLDIQPRRDAAHASRAAVYAGAVRRRASGGPAVARGSARMAASASAPSRTRGPGRLNRAEASTAQTAPRVAAGSSRQAGRSQSWRVWAATAASEEPQGSTATTSGSAAPICSQVQRKDGSRGRLRTSMRPAAAICSGTQCPPTKGGSVHSSARTRGRHGAAVRSRSASRRRRRPAASSRPAAARPEERQEIVAAFDREPEVVPWPADTVRLADEPAV